jgi:Spy/CpxP family protein refolding chaperone
MNFLQQKRVLLWIIAVLLVFNISTGITILYHVIGGKSTQADNTQIDFLQKELNLNPDQTSGLGRIRSQFSRLSQPVTDKIIGLRSELVDEMGKSHPDTIRISELADKLGELQGNLTYQIATRYIGIREICTPEQALKLNSSYQYLFGLENQPQQRGKGFRYRHGQQNRGN